MMPLPLTLDEARGKPLKPGDMGAKPGDMGARGAVCDCRDSKTGDMGDDLA